MPAFPEEVFVHYVISWQVNVVLYHSDGCLPSQMLPFNISIFESVSILPQTQG
jgi:hypothetical protein